jgi:hypothetical protein
MAKKSIAEKIQQIQSQLGRQVELSRSAPPTRILDITIMGYDVKLPIYDEGLEVQCGTLTEVTISAEEIILMILTPNGGAYWTVTPDTKMVLLS